MLSKFKHAQRIAQQTATLNRAVTLRSFSAPNDDKARPFDQQVQETMMNMGLTVGKQVFETAQAFRDLYEDDHDDDEELSSRTPEEKQAR